MRHRYYLWPCDQLWVIFEGTFAVTSIDSRQKSSHQNKVNTNLSLSKPVWIRTHSLKRGDENIPAGWQVLSWPVTGWSANSPHLLMKSCTFPVKVSPFFPKLRTRRESFWTCHLSPTTWESNDRVCCYVVIGTMGGRGFRYQYTVQCMDNEVCADKFCTVSESDKGDLVIRTVPITWT